MLEIQAPLTVAQLPRPLEVDGKFLFNSVYGTSTSRKVKRYEIVVGVDGEAVNLYDVQSSRLVTSYPIPPQATFPCPPCSIRIKNDRKSSPMRFTYCVIERPEPQLQCFSETDQQQSTAAPSVFSLSDTQSPVVFLETIPLRQDPGRRPPCDIVVVHQNGVIRQIAGDLSVQRWLVKITDSSSNPASDLTVTAAHWVSEDQARSSLLKNRPDIHVALDGKESGLLALVAKRNTSNDGGKQDIVYGLWALEEPPPLSARSPQSGHRATPLVLNALPDTNMWKNDASARYSFNTVNGALSVSVRNGIVTYNLSNYAPEVTSKLLFGSTNNACPMRLTPSLVLGSTSSVATLYDSKYNSIQSTIDLEQTGSKRKMKKGNNNKGSSIEFVAYFAKIRKLIALRGHALVAFDITNSAAPGNHHALSGDSMLIDAIGRGNAFERSQHTETSRPSNLDFGTFAKPNNEADGNWASQREQLDKFAEKGDVPKFEALLAKELCSSSDSSELIEFGGLQLPSPARYVDQMKIDYLISKVFEPFSEVDVGGNETTKPGKDLQIALRTPRLIHWLILARQLVGRQFENALARTRPSDIFVLREGAVVKALIEEEPSFELVVDYLKHSPALPLSETLKAVKILLRDVIANSTRGVSPKSWQESGKHHEIKPMADAVPLEQEADIGFIEHLALRMPLPSENTVAPCASLEALLVALRRLGSHSSKDSMVEMQAQLNQSEILAIIQILRQQLFYSGHTSYLPTPPTSAQSSPKLGDTNTKGASMGLDVILGLLSSCLDAIGPVGFLAQSENDKFFERLIPELKSEVSFAFEGMQETNHLQGLLREVIRYADSQQASKGGHVTDHSPSANALIDGRQKPGTIVTLYSEPKTEQGDVEGQGGLLPLSLRATNVVGETKVRKGGGQVSKRSRRDILRLEKRNVGQYSFERLVL